MNFLFEGTKKNHQVIPKKQVSMDIRVNHNAPQYSKQVKKARTHFSFPKKVEANTFSQSGSAFDVSPKNPTYQSLYAKRAEEMTLFHQTKKKKHRGVSFSLPKFSLPRPEFRRFSFSLPRLTPNKLVYGSVMSGVAFGMVSLGLIEKTFESNANAAEEVTPVETISLETANYNPEKDVFLKYFSDAADAEYQEGVREMVKGHPIEEMLPYIFTKDRVTAAFLIGIAKKESNWGKRRPVLDGQDCFNYWGYRGQRRLMGSGGHTCFNSREDAVDTVAKRLETLIHSERLNTPAKLIVWKCGMSCEGHGRESVQKWISDVDAYYSEMMALEAENTEIEDIEDEGA